jgi:hypothetical protein
MLPRRSLAVALHSQDRPGVHPLSTFAIALGLGVALAAARGPSPRAGWRFAVGSALAFAALVTLVRGGLDCVGAALGDDESLEVVSQVLAGGALIAASSHGGSSDDGRPLRARARTASGRSHVTGFFVTVADPLVLLTSIAVCVMPAFVALADAPAAIGGGILAGVLGWWTAVRSIVSRTDATASRTVGWVERAREEVLFGLGVLALVHGAVPLL